MNINDFNKTNRNNMVKRIAEKKKLQEMYLNEAVTLGDVSEAYEEYRKIKNDPKSTEEDIKKAKGHMYYLSRKYRQYRESLGKKTETEVEKKIDQVLKEDFEWEPVEKMDELERAREVKILRDRVPDIEVPYEKDLVKERIRDLTAANGECAPESLELCEKSRHTYYWTCPKCGANLDPGERCDCEDRKPEEPKKEEEKKNLKEEALIKVFNEKEDFDHCYGIPSQKKYPLYDEKHVRSAIRLFGHVEPRFERDLALAIIAKMRKYGIPYDFVGDDNKLKKYLPKTTNEKDKEVITEEEALLNIDLDTLEVYSLYEQLTDISNCNLVNEGAIGAGIATAISAVGGPIPAALIGAGALAAGGLTAAALRKRKKKKENKVSQVTESVCDILSTLDESVLNLLTDEELVREYKLFEASAGQIKSNSPIAQMVKAYLSKYGVKFTWRINKHIAAAESLFHDDPKKIKLAMVAMPIHYINVNNGYDSYTTESKEGTRIILFLDDKIIVYGKGVLSGRKSRTYYLTSINDVVIHEGLVWSKVVLHYKQRGNDYESTIALGRVHKNATQALERFFNSYSNAKFTKTFEAADKELNEDFKAYSDYNIPFLEKSSLQQSEEENELYRWKDPSGKFHNYHNDEERKELIKQWNKEHPQSILTEAVTFVDNAGQVKTMTAVDYVKSMHEYNTKTQIPMYKKDRKKIYKLLSEEILAEDGHLSKDMSVEDIAKKHNVSVEELEKQVKMGIEVEHEHTSDDEEAKRIALDHLYEFPDYYTRLDKMEEEGEKALSESKRQAYRDGGEKLDNYLRGQAIAQIKDPKSRNAAIASVKAGRSEVADNNFVGSRHTANAENRYEEWAGKKASATEDKNKDLKESVLDPVQKERCREIFDSEDKMLPEVKKQILDRFFEWKDGLEEKFTVDAVYLIGSSSGFQYTPASDVDITVVSHDYTDEIWDKVKETMPNGNNLDGTEHPVNYFIRTDMEERKAENIYDIQKDEWVKKTDKAVIDIHMPYIVEMARFFMNAFDLTLKEYERDKMDYLQLKELDPEKVEISEEERADALAAKLTEIKADLDSIRMGNHVLRGFLHEAYEKDDGIFEVHIEIKGGDDPRLSPNNLVYKLLERYGYREKIDATIKEAEEFLESEN